MNLEDIANENEADCAISNSEVRWLIEQIEQLQAENSILKDLVERKQLRLDRSRPVLDAVVDYVGEKNQGACREVVQDLYRDLDKSIKAMEE